MGTYGYAAPEYLATGILELHVLVEKQSIILVYVFWPKVLFRYACIDRWFAMCILSSVLLEVISFVPSPKMMMAECA